jgi:hypothetical protein
MEETKFTPLHMAAQGAEETKEAGMAQAFEDGSMVHEVMPRVAVKAKGSDGTARGADEEARTACGTGVAYDKDHSSGGGNDKDQSSGGGSIPSLPHLPMMTVVVAVTVQGGDGTACGANEAASTACDAGANEDEARSSGGGSIHHCIVVSC